MWLDEHLRHSRGYGVHSPLLYRVVREAMMPHRIQGGEVALYEALRARGVGKRTATRLQNLFTLEGYEQWSIDAEAGESGMMIATSECSEERIGEMVAALGKRQGVLCLLHPLGSHARLIFCRRIVAAHNSMSASKPTFTLLFARKDLQKQHINI